jgi:hypothetical protein
MTDKTDKPNPEPQPDNGTAVPLTEPERRRPKPVFRPGTIASQRRTSLVFAPRLLQPTEDREPIA